MSNRREPHAASALDQMAGHRMPGGCDDCDAYQTVRLVGSIYVLAVHHDQTCPYYRGDTHAQPQQHPAPVRRL